MYQILVGAVGGAFYAGIGLANKKAELRGDFEFMAKKVIKTVLEGAFIGGCLAYSGTEINITTIENFAVSSGGITLIVPVLDKVASLVYNVVKPLKDMF